VSFHARLSRIEALIGADATECQSCGHPLPADVPLSREAFNWLFDAGRITFAPIVLDGGPAREPQRCPTCGRDFSLQFHPVTFDGDRQLSEENLWA
jgi:hypothetical protein